VKKLSLRNDELLVACNSEIIKEEPAKLRLTFDKAFEVLQERNTQLTDEVETLKTTLALNDALHKEGLQNSNTLHTDELNVLCKSLEDSHKTICEELKRQLDDSATQITVLRASIDELTTKNASDASTLTEEKNRAASKLEEFEHQLNDSLTKNKDLTTALETATKRL
jgi:methyl-accepting chemotaxis protein